MKLFGVLPSFEQLIHHFLHLPYGYRGFTPCSFRLFILGFPFTFSRCHYNYVEYLIEPFAEEIFERNVQSPGNLKKVLKCYIPFPAFIIAV